MYQYGIRFRGSLGCGYRFASAESGSIVKLFFLVVCCPWDCFCVFCCDCYGFLFWDVDVCACYLVKVVAVSKFFQCVVFEFELYSFCLVVYSRFGVKPANFCPVSFCARIGGETDVFSPQNITQIYFPKNNSWNTGAFLPNVNSSLSATSVENSIYAIGGTRATIHQGLAEKLQYTPSSTIPEFPAAIILPLILITVVMAIILRQKIHRNINPTIILGA